MENTGTHQRTPKPVEITTAQRKLIDALDKLRHANDGVIPSLEELMAELALSKSVVAKRIKRLRERGVLAAGKGRYRNVSVTPLGRDLLSTKRAAKSRKPRKVLA